MRSFVRILSRPRSLAWRLCLAAILVAVTLGLRYAGAVWLGQDSPYLFQIPALMIITLFSGLGIGLGALMLGLVANSALIPAAYWSNPSAHVQPFLTLFSFLANGGSACLIAALLKTVVVRLRDARQSLDATVVDRAQALATLEALLAHAPIGFAFFNRDLLLVRANDGLARISGVPPDALVGRRIGTEIPAFAPIEHLLAEVFRTGRSILDQEPEGRTATEPGLLRSWSVSCFPVRDPDGSVSLVGITAVEMTEHRRTLRALTESEQRYRHLAEALPKMVWTSRPDGSGDYYNRRWADFTGITDGVLHEWHEFLHPEEREATLAAWRQSVGSGESFTRECRFRAADGSFRWFLCRAVPVRDEDGRIDRWYGSCTDIAEIVAAREALARTNEDLERLAAARTAQLAEANTRLKQEMEDRLQAEAQLRQAQKMEAVGQLTGGIAHDFNNLLTVVIGNLEAVERRVDPDAAEIRRFLDYGRQGALRAASLTQSLLAFSRQQPLDPRPLDVNVLVSGMLAMLNSALNESIVLETVLAGGLWRSEVDPNRLENAILNLAVNARDAMPEGGRLTIETANAYLDDAYAAEVDELNAGAYVMISVRDTGAGMSAEVQARAFEPFFTTKGPKNGSGLGLSQVYGFVKQSGGHLKIHSEAGKGTVVKLYLPRLPEAADAVPAPDAPQPSGVQARILVVQDDPKLRPVCVQTLREAGHAVTEALDPAAAVAGLAGGPLPDLVFIDLASQAAGGGAQLATRIQGHHPHLRVLFTAAGPEATGIRHGHLASGARLLAKPFTQSELEAQVRRVLAGDQRPGPVLLVEDEPFVAMVARQALEDHGFEVTVVSHGEAAIAHAGALVAEASRADPILAIVDVGLPDIRGDAVVNALRAILPGLPVIVATGYGTDGLDLDFSPESRIALLGKPYDGAALERTLAGLGLLLPEPSLDETV